MIPFSTRNPHRDNLCILTVEKMFVSKIVVSAFLSEDENKTKTVTKSATIFPFKSRVLYVTLYFFFSIVCLLCFGLCFVCLF